MKKLFLMFAAVAALFATSCVTDATSDVAVTGGECDVTLSVKAPGADSRATIGTGLKATDLTCAVYDHEWKYLTTKTTTFDNGSLSTTIEMRLVKGKEYNFVFWAQSPEAQANNYYTLTLGSTVGDIVNPSVKVNYDATKDLANDDYRDAFFGNWHCTVTGTINHTVELYRPFAQINFGTNDHFEAEEFGFDVINNPDATTTVTTRAFNTLYLADGAVDHEQDVTFAAAALPVDTTLETKNGDYHWLAMNYILWPAYELSLSTCTMTVAASGHSVTVEVPGAPARRNWRTNLVGKILTEQGNLTVEIKPIPVDQYVGVVEVATAEEFNAAFANPEVDFIVLSGDVHLTQTVTRAAALLTVSAGKTLTIDLNGHKLTAETPQMFEVLGTLVVKNGVVENPAGTVFSAESNMDNISKVSCSIIDDKGKVVYDEESVACAYVYSWSQFVKAVDADIANLVLMSHLFIDKSYDLTKDVHINMNGLAFQIEDPTQHFAVKSNTTIVNGGINGKLYAHSGNITLSDLFFGGSIVASTTKASLQIGSANVSVSHCTIYPYNPNASKISPVVLESRSSGTVTFDTVQFVTENVEVNPIMGDATVEFTNCEFIQAGLRCDMTGGSLTNISMNGNEIPGVEISFGDREYAEGLTEAETAHLEAIKSNNTIANGVVVYYKNTKLVSDWTEFAAAPAGAHLVLTNDITCEKNYVLEKDVVLDLNGKTLALAASADNFSIKANATIKNGNFNGKIYPQSGNVTLSGIKFGGALAYVNATQGVINTKGGNIVIENCDLSKVTVATGKTKPRKISIEGRGSGSIKLSNCNFSNGKLDRAYINPISGTATLEITNCKFGVTTNVETVKAYSLTNFVFSGNSGGFAFVSVGRAKADVTEAEVAHLQAMKSNNSGTLRVDYTDGSVNY